MHALHHLSRSSALFPVLFEWIAHSLSSWEGRFLLLRSYLLFLLGLYYVALLVVVAVIQALVS